MKYRIKHHGPLYIAQRKRWFGWQTLRTGHCWAMTDDIFIPTPIHFTSITEAQDAIKTAVIYNGMALAHTRVAKIIPPWNQVKAGVR